VAPLDGGYPLKALQVPNQVAALMAQHAKVGQLHRASVMLMSYQEMRCNPYPPIRFCKCLSLCYLSLHELLKAMVPASRPRNKNYMGSFESSSTLACYLNPETGTIPATGVVNQNVYFFMGHAAVLTQIEKGTHR